MSSGLDDDIAALATVAAQAAESKDGEAIEVLDVSGVFVICDAFVLVSGRTERQVRALADEIEHQVREKTGRTPTTRHTPCMTYVCLDVRRK